MPPNPYYQPGYFELNDQYQPFSRQNIGGTIGAGLGFAQDIIQNQSMAAPNAIQTQTPTEEVDQFGRPLYNLGQQTGMASSIDPASYGTNVGSVLGSAGQGAMLGTQIMPGIGTAVGAVVGAATNLIGGARRKRRARQKRDQAFNALRTSQGNYNEGVESYESGRRATQNYNNQLNTQGRMYNLATRGNIYG